MKKLISILIIAIIFTTGAFASGTNESKTGKAKGQTIVKYAFWGNPDAIGVEKAIIDKFEATYPNIKIEPIVAGYSDYHSKLMTMIAGGMAPDVMRIDSYNFSDFMALGAVTNLDPYIEKTNFDMNIYPVVAVDESTIDGSVYALPWATAPLYMMLNLKAFEKAKIDLPAIDWTVDDFERIIKEFKEADINCYGFSTAIEITPLLPYIWANGGNLLSDDLNTFILDQPEACKGIQMIADLYQEGYLPKDTISVDADTLTRWFTNGSIAMRPGSAMDLLTTQNIEGSRVEAWTMPGGVTKNTTVYKSNEICISKDSNVKDAAWTFMTFLRGNEGERLYITARRMPPSLLNDTTLWPSYMDVEKYPKQIQNVTNQIAKIYGHKLPLRKGYPELRDGLTPILQKIVMGDSTATKALAANKNKFQSIIDRNNK